MRVGVVPGTLAVCLACQLPAEQRRGGGRNSCLHVYFALLEVLPDVDRRSDLVAIDFPRWSFVSIMESQCHRKIRTYLPAILHVGFKEVLCKVPVLKASLWQELALTVGKKCSAHLGHRTSEHHESRRERKRVVRRRGVGTIGNCISAKADAKTAVYDEGRERINAVNGVVTHKILRPTERQRVFSLAPG